MDRAADQGEGRQTEFLWRVEERVMSMTNIKVKAKQPWEMNDLAIAPNISDETSQKADSKLIAALEKKEFFGTIDRLKRGVITEDEARAELNGDTSHINIDEKSGVPNPAEYAAKLKANGVGRRESWSRWVQRTSLNPGMDAKDWYVIYDCVVTIPKVRPKPSEAKKVKTKQPWEMTKEP